jgi:hypothetical protein
MNNHIEQDHRGSKGHYHALRCFGSFGSAARFCSAHDEVGDYVRPRTRLNEVVPLWVQREQFCTRLAALRRRIQATAAGGSGALHHLPRLREAPHNADLQNVSHVPVDVTVPCYRPVTTLLLLLARCLQGAPTPALGSAPQAAMPLFILAFARG